MTDFADMTLRQIAQVISKETDDELGAPLFPVITHAIVMKIIGPLSELPLVIAKAVAMQTLIWAFKIDPSIWLKEGEAPAVEPEAVVM